MYLAGKAGFSSLHRSLILGRFTAPDGNRFLQEGQCFMNRPHLWEGAKIFCPANMSVPGDDCSRCFIAKGYGDIWVAFIIAKHHVEGWSIGFDPTVLKLQCFNFAPNDGPLDS